MDRRTYLATVGSVGLGVLAGCVSTTSTTAEPTDTPTDTPTSTTEELSAEATVESSQLDTWDLGSSSRVGAVGKIRNTGGWPLLAVTVKAKFYDGAGDLLNSAATQMMGLYGDGVWEPWLTYTGDHDPESVELTVSNVQPSRQHLDGGGDVYDVTDTVAESPEDDLAYPRVSGTVEKLAETDRDRIRLIVKVADNTDTILNHATDVITGMSVGESWDFDLRIPFENTSRTERLDGYQALLYY